MTPQQQLALERDQLARAVVARRLEIAGGKARAPRPRRLHAVPDLDAAAAVALPALDPVVKSGPADPLPTPTGRPACEACGGGARDLRDGRVPLLAYRFDPPARPAAPDVLAEARRAAAAQPVAHERLAGQGHVDSPVDPGEAAALVLLELQRMRRAREVRPTGVGAPHAGLIPSSTERAEASNA